MDQTMLISLLGGLALFLYGMHMMSAGLEAAAGAKLKHFLERFTQNRFLAVLVGAGITALVQSSSATTVMVIGFVSSRMMPLSSAVWVIMGANVGTTVTGLMITLDMGDLAPLFTFFGVAMTLFFKNQRIQHYGQILAGLGILFIGMGSMSDAMYPLRDSAEFIALMSRFSNPVLGIMGGAVFTALVQSSSASIGILQGLASSGVIELSQAIFVLFGQNIGTCITAIIASISLSRNAKRVTLVHLMFNFIGTSLFTIITLTTSFTDFVVGLTPGNVQAQIANTHVIFNIATTLLLMPFGGYLATIAKKMIPSTEDDFAGEIHVKYLTPVQTINTKEGGLGASAIYVSQLRSELARMLVMARGNVVRGFDGVIQGDLSTRPDAVTTEDYIDYLNKEISTYISRVIASETNEQASEIVSNYFTITSNIERIGDHAMNICDCTKILLKREITFSDDAYKELTQMRDASLSGIDLLLQISAGEISWLTKVAALEQKIDDMSDQFRRRHIKRMRDSQCHGEATILYAELLTDFERLGDHILNIGEALAIIESRS